MAQYFENDPGLKDNPSVLSFTIRDRQFELQTNSGVFSKDKLDQGTRILLETVLEHEDAPGSVLDLGCGIGTVGIVLKSFWDCEMTMIDINERAAELARTNLKKLHLSADVRLHDGIDAGEYDCIVLNPPIRAGKQVIYTLFDQCLDHLKGRLWIVIRKQHGAQSAVNYLTEKGCKVERMNRKNGYWILKVEK